MGVKEWAGHGAASSPQPGQGRAGQDQGKDCCLLTLAHGQPWLEHLYNCSSKCPAAFSYSCRWPSLCKESETLGVYLSGLSLPWCQHTIYYANRAALTIFILGRILALAREFFVDKTELLKQHTEGQLPWEQMALASMYKHHGG